MKIEEAFGIAIKHRTDLEGRKHLVPPPPNVLRVLGNISFKAERGLPGHGPKTAKRRSKRRRLRARDTVLRRHVLRSYHERLKRES